MPVSTAWTCNEGWIESSTNSSKLYVVPVSFFFLSAEFTELENIDQRVNLIGRKKLEKKLKKTVLIKNWRVIKGAYIHGHKMINLILLIMHVRVFVRLFCFYCLFLSLVPWIPSWYRTMTHDDSFDWVYSFFFCARMNLGFSFKFGFPFSLYNIK